VDAGYDFEIASKVHIGPKLLFNSFSNGDINTAITGKLTYSWP
jgi:hypothetical protein